MAKDNYLARSTDAKIKIPVEELDRIIGEYLKQDLASEMRVLREKNHIQQVEIGELKHSVLELERKLDKIIKIMMDRWTLKPHEENILE